MVAIVVPVGKPVVAEGKGDGLGGWLVPVGKPVVAAEGEGDSGLVVGQEGTQYSWLLDKLPKSSPRHFSHGHRCVVVVRAQQELLTKPGDC